MATNRFRGDAQPLSKIITLIAPGGTGQVSAELTCGTRTFKFDTWNATTIVAALVASGIPEFQNLIFAVFGSNITVTGPLDEDFNIGLSYRPTITLTHVTGTDPVNQQTRLDFYGARAGTYTLTVNTQTTSAITYGDQVGLIAALEALSNVGVGDVKVVSATADYIILEWQAVLAALPVAVSMSGLLLQNNTNLFVKEITAYSPGPHDVIILGMEPSTTCAVIIDGVTANLRSDEGLESTRAKLKACVPGKLLNVYGGYTRIPDGYGIERAQFILDFAGWTSASPPVTSITYSDGAAYLWPIYKTAGAVYCYEFYEETVGPNLGAADFQVVDYTGGDTITLEYDGIQIGPFTKPTGGTAGISAFATALQIAIWNVSEYDEVQVGIAAKDAPGVGVLSAYNMNFLYIMNANISLKQVGGTATLRSLNKPGTAAAAAVHSISVPALATTGTWRVILPEGTTAALAATAAAATVEAQFDALVGATSTVTGAGTPNAPWIVTYPAAALARPLPIPFEVKTGGAGSGLASVSRYSLIAATQSARLALSTNAASGSFTLFFGTDGPITITVGDSAATVDTALGLLPTIGGAANVTTTYDATSKSYDFVFASALAGRLLPLFRVGVNSIAFISATTFSIDQRATGPRNFAEPTNWLLGLPVANDQLVIETSSSDIMYGLRQFPVVTVNTTTEIFTAVGGHDFRSDQQIRFATAGTLPAGVSAGVTYFVLDADNEAGTFRVAATAGGAAINITTTGSGTIYAGLLTAGIRIAASYSDSIGKAEYTDAGAIEYRHTNLSIGVTAAGICEIGTGPGNGSGMIKLNLGYSPTTVRVLKTDRVVETDRMAVNLLINAPTSIIDVASGDVGIASFETESASLGELRQTGGTIFCGTVATTSVNKIGGRLLSRALTVTGNVAMMG